MLSEAAGNFCMLKREFFKTYNGSSHIQEAVPRGTYHGIDTASIHRLAEANPIYHNAYDATIAGTRCAIYEGDINHYWIDSMKNPGSAQPFYPTWLFSAYLLALAVKRTGCDQIIDVGSGDGRIAICGTILGMDVCSIEIDESLASLQKEIVRDMDMSLDVQCADATRFDYASLRFSAAAVFTGGLPQMGDLLAASVIQGISHTQNTRFILAGSHPRPTLGTPPDHYGWGSLIKRFTMKVTWVINLPTVWTFDQSQDTPYICASP